MFVLYCIFIALIPVLIGCISAAIKLQKRQNLAKAVVKMGDGEGKTFNDFQDTMGAPTNIDVQDDPTTGEMTTIATWCSGGYEIKVKFDEFGQYVKVVSEALHDN